MNWVLGPENTRKPIDEFETINYSSQATKIGHREKIIIIIIIIMQRLCLQCFDAVGWAAGRASGL